MGTKGARKLGIPGIVQMKSVREVRRITEERRARGIRQAQAERVRRRNVGKRRGKHGIGLLGVCAQRGAHRGRCRRVGGKASHIGNPDDDSGAAAFIALKIARYAK